MEPSGRVLLAFLCLSLAVCVLGRPQPNSTSPQYSTLEVLGNSSLQGSNRNLGILHFGTLEVPWRRSLKRSGGTGFKARGGRIGSSGGGGAMSTTIIINIVVSIVIFVLLLAAYFFCPWPKDYFKRNKVPREKMLTSAKSDVDPDADAQHKVSIDVPRLDHAKSRRQVSLNHEFKDFKDSSSST